VEALVFDFNVRKHSHSGEEGCEMKILKVLLAVVNVFVLTFYVISFLIPRPTRSVGLAPGFIISCAMVFAAIYLLFEGDSNKTLVIWLIGVLLIFFGFATVCVIFAPDKNGMFWIDEKGRFFTRSLN
jgi:glucose uptake protein GlcU